MILDRSLIILAVAAVACAAALLAGDRPLRLAALLIAASFVVSVASEIDSQRAPPLACTVADGLCATALAAMLFRTEPRMWLASAAAAQALLTALDGSTVVIDGRHLPLYFRAANLLHGVLILAVLGGVLAAARRRRRAASVQPTPAQ